MDHVIKVPFSGSAESLFATAKARAESQGVRMEGSWEKGTFSGLGAQGNYETQGQEVTITITKKPAMFPQAMIDAMVKKMFS